MKSVKKKNAVADPWIRNMSHRERRCASRNRWVQLMRETRPKGLETESIVEALEKISKSIPEEALRNIPSDWSKNYRKYLYGQ